MKFTVLIADDEAMTRHAIRSYLSEHQDFEVIGEADNGMRAADKAMHLRPDLMFLDVQMPLRTGLDVLGGLPPAEMPLVIFVTAYQEYALAAFEHRALDYLLKPFDRERFGEALERARKMLQLERSNAELKRSVVKLAQSAAPGALDRIAIRAKGRNLYLSGAELHYARAQGNYVQLVCSSGTFFVRQTLTEMLARLNPAYFQQVHKSYAVNLARVRELQSLTTGDVRLLLDTGAELRLSRRFRVPFLAAMADFRERYRT